MVLIKAYHDLAFRFGIMDISILDDYHGRQTLAIKLSEREELWQTMLQCFEFSFGNRTTVIIYYFELEVFIERPTNPLAKA